MSASARVGARKAHAEYVHYGRLNPQQVCADISGAAGRHGGRAAERVLRVVHAAEQVRGREQDGRLPVGLQQRVPRRVLSGRGVSESRAAGARCRIVRGNGGERGMEGGRVIARSVLRTGFGAREGLCAPPEKSAPSGPGYVFRRERCGGTRENAKPLTYNLTAAPV